MTCTYTEAGTRCDQPATHAVVTSLRAGGWMVLLADATHTAEFCLRHATDVQQARQTAERQARARREG